MFLHKKGRTYIIKGTESLKHIPYKEDTAPRGLGQSFGSLTSTRDLSGMMTVDVVVIINSVFHCCGRLSYIFHFNQNFHVGHCYCLSSF